MLEAWFLKLALGSGLLRPASVALRRTRLDAGGRDQEFLSPFWCVVRAFGFWQCIEGGREGKIVGDVVSAVSLFLFFLCTDNS